MSKKVLVFLSAFALVLILTGQACSNTSETETEEETTAGEESPDTSIVDVEPVDDGQLVPGEEGSDTEVIDEDQSPEEPAASVGETKEFAVGGKTFEFSLKEIRVNEGDTVRIVFTNNEGFHDWVIDEFNARTSQIQEGQSETIEFVADQAGEFEYYCSVGEHRELGMVGKLIVE